jgi:hypothetical protein
MRFTQEVLPYFITSWSVYNAFDKQQGTKKFIALTNHMRDITPLMG